MQVFSLCTHGENVSIIAQQNLFEIIPFKSYKMPQSPNVQGM